LSDKYQVPKGSVIYPAAVTDEHLTG